MWIIWIEHNSNAQEVGEGEGAGWGGLRGDSRFQAMGLI